MKYAYYNENGEVLGFYDDEIHSEIPSPNLALSDEEWEEALRSGANFVSGGELIKKSSIVEEFKARVQEILDSKARELGYDSMVSAVSYAGFKNSFQAEALKLGKWRSEVWAWGNELLNTYKDAKEEPLLEELLLGMPKASV